MTSMERRSLWIAILGTLFLQLFMTGFFSFGSTVPLTIDTHLGNYRQSQFHFPPQGEFNTDFWLGLPQLPNGLHPLSLFAHLPFWIFASAFYPLCASASLYFTFILFQAWGFRPFSSIFAGILFAWQGSFLSNLLPAHFSPAALFAFFPLTFYWITKARQKNSLLYWGWAGVGSGMMMLFLPDQGFLANLLIALYLVVFSLFQLFSKPTDSTDSALSPQSKFRRLLFGLLLWATVSFAVSLPGIESIVLQNIKAIQQGASESPEKKYEWATQWSFPPEEIIQYIVPGFLGWHNLSQEGPYWGRIGQSADWKGNDQGMRNYMLGINTLGTVPFLLALLGLAFLFKRYRIESPSLSPVPLRRTVIFFFWSGFLLLLLGLGKYGPLYPLFYMIPGMDSWRNPLKFILLPGNFCLLVLSVYGAEQIALSIRSKATAPDSLQKIKPLALLLWGALLFLIPLYLLLTILLPAILPLFHYSPSESGHIVGTILGSILVTLLIASFWFSLLHLLERSRLVRHYPILNPWISRLRNLAFQESRLEATWFTGLILLVVLQLSWIHQHYLFPRPLDNLSHSSDLIRYLKKENLPVRVKLLSRDSFLDEHLNIRFPIHGIATVDIPAASRTPLDYQLFFEKMAPFPLRLSELCAVQYYIGQSSAWAQYSQDPQLKNGLGKTTFFAPGDTDENLLKELPDPNGSLYAVSELKNALPRLSLIPQYEVLPSEELLFTRLQDPLWEPKNSILLLHPPDLDLLPPPSNPLFLPPSLSVQEYTSQRIRCIAESSVPCFLLIADRFDPDWKVQINGKEGSILRANFIQRAILIPAGRSEITLRYSPPVFSIYLQLFTLLSLTLLTVRVTRFAHRCDSTPHNKP